MEKIVDRKNVKSVVMFIRNFVTPFMSHGIKLASLCSSSSTVNQNTF